MNLRRFAIITAALAAIACTQQSPAKPKPETLAYEVKLKSPVGNMGTRKMYVKGSNFAWITESAGLKIKFVKNDEGAFLIHPSNKYAGKYSADSNRNSPMAFLPGPVGDVKAFLKDNGAKKTGTGKVSGKKCDAYEYTEKLTKWKCKVWVDKKTMTPVKMQMKGAKKSDRIDVTYVSYKLGAAVADSVFDLPKDIPIRPMPSGRGHEGKTGGTEPAKP